MGQGACSSVLTCGVLAWHGRPVCMLSRKAAAPGHVPPIANSQSNRPPKLCIVTAAPCLHDGAIAAQVVSVGRAVDVQDVPAVCVLLTRHPHFQGQVKHQRAAQAGEAVRGLWRGQGGLHNAAALRRLRCVERSCAGWEAGPRLRRRGSSPAFTARGTRAGLT